MSDEASRLVRAETHIDRIHEELHGEDGLSKRLREVEKTVWKAFGAIAVVQIIIVVAVEMFARK